MVPAFSGTAHDVVSPWIRHLWKISIFSLSARLARFKSQNHLHRTPSHEPLKIPVNSGLETLAASLDTGENLWASWWTDYSGFNLFFYIQVHSLPLCDSYNFQLSGVRWKKLGGIVRLFILSYLHFLNNEFNYSCQEWCSAIRTYFSGTCSYTDDACSAGWSRWPSL
jgi:hypothetical protein